MLKINLKLYLKMIHLTSYFMVFFTLSISTQLFVFSAGRRNLQLSKAIEVALLNNREIKTLEKEIEKAEENIKVSSRILQSNPEISFETLRRHSHTENILDYSISISQRIEVRGQMHNRVNISKLNLFRAEIMMQKEKLMIIEKVKNIFVNLFSLQNKCKAFNELLIVEDDLLKWMKIRAGQGKISSIELNTILIETLRTKEKILNIKNEITSKICDLEWIMNIDLPENLVIDYKYSEFPPNIDFKRILNYVEKYNPDIKIASANLKKAEYYLKLSKAQRGISSISPSLIYTREDRDNLIGIGLSIPLPILNLKKGLINIARIDFEKAKLKLRQTREKIFAEIEKLQKSFDTKSQLIELYNKQIIPITEKSLKELSIRYQLGEIDLIILERYFDKWVNSNVDYTNFIQGYYSLLNRIEFLSGIELKEINREENTQE